MSLRGRTLAGLSWSFASQALRQVAQLAIGVLLARALAPEVFGFVAMVEVFTGFLAVLAGMGLGAALVQQPSVSQEQYSTVFWLGMAVSFLVVTALWFSAPLIAGFYAREDLEIIARMLAFAFPLQIASVIPRALLSRALDFRSQAIADSSAVIVSGIVAVTMAWMDNGVFALLARELVLPAVATSVLWVRARWVPSPTVVLGSSAQLLKFGLNLVGFQAFNYWTRRADNLLIGKYLGSAQLGVYDRAYRLMLLPMGQVTAAVTQVMFPALSQIQNDQQRVKRAYLKAVGAISLITFPMMMGLLVVCDDFVLTLLGVKWVGVIPVLRALALVGMFESIGSTVGWIYQSQGRTDVMLKWGIATGVLSVVGHAIGIRWGLAGVTSVYAIRSAILVYPGFAIPGRFIGMSFGEVVKAVRGVLMSAALMAAGVWLLRGQLPDVWPPIARLGVQVFFGSVFYLGILVVCRPPAFEDVVRLVARR